MKRINITERMVQKWIWGCVLVLFSVQIQAQMVHPGISHVKSDLDRMKYMVETGAEPWLSTFNSMKESSYASYNYTVNGSAANTIITSHGDFMNDGYAAYYNALMWYITGDERHAQKCVEIFNAWVNIKRIEDQFPLNNGRGPWKMLEGAEIIRYTYDGWAEEDIKKFEAMLVYPGWSGTAAPTAAIASKDVSFYWNIYQGDPARHGNQGLFAYRSLMAMGIFLDNEIIYERALRYLEGLPHREDDLPYPSGPPVTTPMSSGTEYYDEFRQVSRSDEIQDYGYNEVMANYIWENGQCQEASRDQAHSLGGISIISCMCEMAWSQGDDLFGHLDNRPLLGFEYLQRYNLSYDVPFPDQPTPWEPTAESGEFIQRLDRTGRWKSLKINPYVATDTTRWSRGAILEPVYELFLGHYKDRLELPDDKLKWTERGYAYMQQVEGVEDGRHAVDHAGYGGVKFHRVSPGDPISGFDADGLPVYDMPTVPVTIEAENFDHFPIQGDKLTHHDVDTINTGGKYRLDQGVDIDTCSEGGYQLTHLEAGEWLTYTVYVPASSLYTISIRYAAANADGKIKFSFAGEDVSEEVTVPFAGEYSGALNDWKDFTVASDVILSKGVQAMKISISGASNAFVLNNITIEEGSAHGCEGGLPAIETPPRLMPGVNYTYYEGAWDVLPDFDALSPVLSDTTNTIHVINGIETDTFALVFEAYLYTPLNGTYTFYLSSADGSRLFIDNNEILDNDGLHDVLEVSTDVCMNGGYHAVKVEYFNHTGQADLSVMYAGPGISKQMADLFIVGPCDNLPVTAPDNLVKGIKYTYYEGVWDNIPNFNALTGLERGLLSSFSLSPASVSDYFAMTFDGYIDIAADGDYTFYLSSDDGSRLLLDGNVIINNDGTHGVVMKTGSTCLAPGYHQIRVEYFEKTGGNTLIVGYEGPGVSKTVLNNVIYSEPVPPREDQMITFPELPVKTVGDRPFELGATSSTGFEITYTSSDETVAIIRNGRIYIRGAGTAVITASLPQTIDYNAASVEQLLTVEADDVSVDGVLKNRVKVYPNPVSDQLTITMSEVTNAHLELFSCVGLKIIEQEISGETNIDISHLSSGMYMVRIGMNGSFMQQKIIKE